LKILFAASEAFPFIKTGGLADVLHGLPQALSQLGNDVKLVLPAYRDVLASVDSLKELGYWNLPGAGVTHRVRVLQAQHKDLDDFLYLIDVPALFDRSGNPYVTADGFNWPDNAERFTVFSRAVAEMAKGIPGINWQPDVVHCNDWQTGLVPALISMSYPRPKTIFTIHNLAYHGSFSYHEYISLVLPPEWWSPGCIEFYGGFSMLKAGLMFADQVTTVSPTYAREICTTEYGFRFEGVLQHLGDKLTGIINGIDLDVWNPETDEHLSQNYGLTQTDVKSARSSPAWLKAKAAIKRELLNRVKLKNTKAPLLGFIGRLVEQKGVDLISRILPELFATSDASVIILGSGDKLYQAELLALADKYPTRLHVHIGYSEELAHQIEAGCDLFLMPSRFEPCGLNQMYSLRYGTPPLVNFTGGLADTVTNTTASTLKNKTANGFVFYQVNAAALLSTVNDALKIYQQPKLWQQVCETAMQQKLGWESSAKKYQELYNRQ